MGQDHSRRVAFPAARRASTRPALRAAPRRSLALHRNPSHHLAGRAFNRPLGGPSREPSRAWPPTDRARGLSWADRRCHRPRPPSVPTTQAKRSTAASSDLRTPQFCGRMTRTGLRRVYAFAAEGLRPPTGRGESLGFMRPPTTRRDGRRQRLNARNEGVRGSNPRVGCSGALVRLAPISCRKCGRAVVSRAWATSGRELVRTPRSVCRNARRRPGSAVSRTCRPPLQTPAGVLAAQRLAGNQAIQRLLRPATSGSRVAKSALARAADGSGQDLGGNSLAIRPAPDSSPGNVSYSYLKSSSSGGGAFEFHEPRLQQLPMATLTSTDQQWSGDWQLPAKGDTRAQRDKHSPGRY